MTERWAQVRARMLVLLDPLRLESGIRQATDGWTLLLLKGIRLPLSEILDVRLLNTAYQLTMFSRSVPAEYRDEDLSLYRNLDRVAQVLDIYARLQVAIPRREGQSTEDRNPTSRQLARVATLLYTMAQQPTKAYRVSRSLTSNSPNDDGLTRVALEDALASRALMGGSAGQEVADVELATKLAAAPAAEPTSMYDDPKGIPDDSGQARDTARYFVSKHGRIVGDSAETPEAGGGSRPQLTLAPASLVLQAAHAAALEAQDAESLSFVREFMLLSAYHRGADLRQALIGAVSADYISACALGTPSERRAELLPPQLWAVRNGLLDSQTIVLSTPTGSGKTFMGELRIAAEVKREKEALCVYIAPFNALADQTYRTLRTRLDAAGVRVTLWTGAYEIDDSEISLGNVLITTPEKLDYLLRASDDDSRAADLRSRCRLFILDEAHVISTGIRGIRYELLVQRLQQQFPHASMLAISGVVADTSTLARWLTADGSNPARELRMNWQPSAVRDILWAADGRLELRGGDPLAFELPRPKAVRSATALLAATLLSELPSILLVETRKDYAQGLAHELFENFRPTLLARLERKVRGDPGSLAKIEAAVALVKRVMHPKHRLAEYMRCGLAFHHAGLPMRIRRVVEQLAREELVHTLVATTTLAEGMDLAFRAVVMVHLSFPDGPVPARILRNIRGRAARPYYANDGLFIIVEPEKTDTAAYEHFRMNYWSGGDSLAGEPVSSLNQLWDWRAGRRGEARRILQSQLLALFSEEEIEADEVPDLAGRSLLASALGQDAPTVRSLATVIADEVTRMRAEPALLRAASPLRPTTFGKQAILGGLSADSAWLIRDVLLRTREDLTRLLDERGASWVAVRLSWLPWEAFELSRSYAEAARLAPGVALTRAAEDLIGLEDSRLAPEYSACSLLLSPATFDELGRENLPFIRGRDALDRMTSAIDWANDASTVLPWTISGVIRIADGLSEDLPEFGSLATALRPFIPQFQTWIPSSLGQELLSLDLARDQIVELTRLSVAQTPSELLSWLELNGDTLAEIVSEDELATLRSWLAAQPDF